MPYKDPQKAKERKRAYYLAHREESLKRSSEWAKKNREHVNELKRAGREKNKEHDRAVNRAWKAKNRDRINAVSARRQAERLRDDPEFREKRNQSSREHYKKYRDKMLDRAKQRRQTKQAKANTLVMLAIKSGALIRPTRCSDCLCETDQLHAHHPDYSKPLDVVFLCSLCHGRQHREHNG